MEFNEKENAILYDFGKMHKIFEEKTGEKRLGRTGERDAKKEGKNGSANLTILQKTDTIK